MSDPLEHHHRLRRSGYFHEAILALFEFTRIACDVMMLHDAVNDDSIGLGLSQALRDLMETMSQITFVPSKTNDPRWAPLIEPREALVNQLKNLTDGIEGLEDFRWKVNRGMGTAASGESIIFAPKSITSQSSRPYLVLLFDRFATEPPVNNSQDNFTCYLALGSGTSMIRYGGPGKAPKNWKSEELRRRRNILYTQAIGHIHCTDKNFKAIPPDSTDRIAAGSVDPDYTAIDAMAFSYSLQDSFDDRQIKRQLLSMVQMYLDAGLKEIILTDEVVVAPGGHVGITENHSEVDVVSRAVALITAGYRNLMLSGPPGTSKSHVVGDIAKALLERIFENTEGPLPKAKIVNLQFHPAYSYEDFVEGWRPIKSGNGENTISDGPPGAPNFDVVPGALLKAISDSNQVANQQLWWDSRKEEFGDNDLRLSKARWSASKAGGAQILPPVFIVLDEVNRANIPRVFGEVLQLIEVSKRSNVPKGPDFHEFCKTSIRLAVSGEELVIPENFIFISTMNTSDRSIARIDDAFRRRFTFIDCQPDPERLKNVWEETYSDYPKKERALGPDQIARGFHALNKALDASLFLGKLVGHTYFMPNSEEAAEGFTQEFLTRRWDYQVFPYLLSVDPSLKSVDGDQGDGVNKFAKIENWL